MNTTLSVALLVFVKTGLSWAVFDRSAMVL
ncbi:MAG: hypothetical protein JCHSAcid_03000 [uncultured Acidilobus sp. JCHS]|nr:MAG: hypothetical protein JCHSAcid_03000 [uncultured Acidilobus sp. JCHS]